MAVTVTTTRTIEVGLFDRGNLVSSWRLIISLDDGDDEARVGFFFGDTDTPTHSGNLSRSDLAELFGELVP